jgi:hypothetical protein
VGTIEKRRCKGTFFPVEQAATLISGCVKTVSQEKAFSSRAWLPASSGVPAGAYGKAIIGLVCNELRLS